MEAREDVRFKQCAIECLTAEKIPPIDITVVCRQFKQEVEKVSLCNQARSLRPVTTTYKSHQECVEEMIGENGQIKQKNIALKLGTSKERVGHITNLLGFQKGCARWATQKLTDGKKTERIGVSREILDHSEE
jgi:hypothetical protein